MKHFKLDILKRNRFFATPATIVLDSPHSSAPSWNKLDTRDALITVLFPNTSRAYRNPKNCDHIASILQHNTRHEVLCAKPYSELPTIPLSRRPGPIFLATTVCSLFVRFQSIDRTLTDQHRHRLCLRRYLIASQTPSVGR